MTLLNYVLCICVAILVIVLGIYPICRVVVTQRKRDLRFGEGQTLQKLDEIYKDNQIMKKALIDIVNATVLIRYDPPEGAEIDDYRQVVNEMSYDIRKLQAKAYCALHEVSEEVE